MRTDAVVQMQNQAGRLLQYIASERFADIPGLFCRSDESILTMPDRKEYFKGYDNIETYFVKMAESARMANAPKAIYLTNTPAFHAPEDDILTKGVWEAYSFRIYPACNNEKAKYEFFSSRFDISFQKEENEYKIINMCWYELMSFLPIEYSQTSTLELFKPALFEVPAPTGYLSPEDFVEIQRTMGRFMHNNRSEAFTIFSDSDEISFRMSNVLQKTYTGRKGVIEALKALDELEADNGGKFVSIPFLTTPVVEIEPDGKHASGSWLVLCFDIKGEAFGREREKPEIVKVLGRLNQKFIKENGEWRILKYDLSTLTALPPLACLTPDRLPPAAEKYKYWDFAPQRTKNKKSSSDVFEIESLLLHWTTGLKTGTLVEFTQKHMTCEKSNWTVILGDYVMHGEKAVTDGLAKMDKEHHELEFKSPIVHTGSTPVIEISQDGLTAEGIWFDHSYTNVAQSGKDFRRPFRYMMNTCKYHHWFKKENGSWKLEKFTWDIIFSMEDYFHEPNTSSGWAGSGYKVPWPKPFEKYELGTTKDKKDS